MRVEFDITLEDLDVNVQVIAEIYKGSDIWPYAEILKVVDYNGTQLKLEAYHYSYLEEQALDYAGVW